MKNTENNFKECTRCNQIFEKKTSRQIYCFTCSFRKKAKVPYVKKPQESKICVICNQQFMPAAKNEKVCSPSCRNNKNAKDSKDRWINRKERDTQPGLEDFLSRGRVAKKRTSWMQKYNPCQS